MDKIGDGVLSDVRRTDDAWEAEIVFPSGSLCFEGHFPGFPILPGVVQLATAQAAAERLAGRRLAVSSVRKMKFSHVLRPDGCVRLAVTRKAAGVYVYVYTSGDAVCASGELHTTEATA